MPSNMNTKLDSYRKNKQYAQSGFIQIIVIIVVALIILRLVGVHIEDILAKPWVKDFAREVKEMLILVWQDILKIFGFAKEV